jgi:hypothetical protein
MPKQRNSITINIDEYEFEIIFRNYTSTNLSHIYIFIRKNHTIAYWTLCYQKNNQFIIGKIREDTLSEFEYNMKFIDLLRTVNIIEPIEGELCLKNEILLQLI